MNSEVFETLSPTKLFFRCAVPSMITMAFGALYQIADGLFMGRFIGEDALAAINLIMPIIMMVFGFANLIATGASVRIGILLGEKKREEASQIFTFTLNFIFLISCLIGLFGYFTADKLGLPIVPPAEILKFHTAAERISFVNLGLKTAGAEKLFSLCGKGAFATAGGTATENIFKSLCHFATAVLYIGVALKPLEFVVIKSFVYASCDFLLVNLKKLVGCEKLREVRFN